MLDACKLRSLQFSLKVFDCAAGPHPAPRGCGREAQGEEGAVDCEDFVDLRPARPVLEEPQPLTGIGGRRGA